MGRLTGACRAVYVQQVPPCQRWEDRGLEDEGRSSEELAGEEGRHGEMSALFPPSLLVCCFKGRTDTRRDDRSDR